MHVLIIPGEELNDNNTLSSVFEIHQAQALKGLKVKVGFISTLLRSSIHKELIRQIKKLDFRFKSKFRIEEKQIKDINLVLVSGVYLTPYLLNLHQKERIRAGVRAFKYYNKQFGRPDIIHAHSRFLESILIAKKIKEMFGIPYVITEHSTFHQRNIVSKKEYIKYIGAVEQSESWIVVSESLGNRIISNIRKCNLHLKKSFMIVPNVVDPNFRFVELGESNKFVFLNIATLDEKKNHKLLLDSFKILTESHKNVELRIGGAGPLQGDLMLHVDALKLKNVKFLGLLDRDDVLKELIDSNSFILSSDVETFGVVIIEALMIGRPVVATKCGGPEHVISDSNGILVETGNQIQLVDAMRQIMENYSHYNLKAISEDCLENFGEQAVGSILIDIYNAAVI